MLDIPTSMQGLSEPGEREIYLRRNMQICHVVVHALCFEIISIVKIIVKLDHLQVQALTPGP